jgi:type III HopA1-like effector protein
VSRYRDQTAAAVAAVTLLGPTRYAWLGRRSRGLAPLVDAELDDGLRRRYLTSCLREELYHSFYCHGAPVPARWGEPQPPRADGSLVAALSAANTGRGSWENGWAMERVDGDEVVVRGGRLRVRAAVADCRGAGAAVSLRVPSELPSLSPGFWFAIGDAPSDGMDIRVYWNVSPGGAARLVASVTGHLNAAGVPFRLKVADHPYRFARRDAAVLYLAGAAFRERRRELVELARGLALRPGVPAWTLEVAPGLGAAEDRDGESFGMARCEVVAEAIAGGEAVEARFAEAGVDIDAPYRAGRGVL